MEGHDKLSCAGIYDQKRNTKPAVLISCAVEADFSGSSREISLGLLFHNKTDKAMDAVFHCLRLDGLEMDLCRIMVEKADGKCSDDGFEERSSENEANDAESYQCSLGLIPARGKAVVFFRHNSPEVLWTNEVNILVPIAYDSSISPAQAHMAGIVLFAMMNATLPASKRIKKNIDTQITAVRSKTHFILSSQVSGSNATAVVGPPVSQSPEWLELSFVIGQTEPLSPTLDTDISEASERDFSVYSESEYSIPSSPTTSIKGALRPTTSKESLRAPSQDTSFFFWPRSTDTSAYAESIPSDNEEPFELVKNGVFEYHDEFAEFAYNQTFTSLLSEDDRPPLSALPTTTRFWEPESSASSVSSNEEDFQVATALPVSTSRARVIDISPSSPPTSPKSSKHNGLKVTCVFDNEPSTVPVNCPSPASIVSNQSRLYEWLWPELFSTSAPIGMAV